MSVTTLNYEKFITGTLKERKQFAEDVLDSFLLAVQQCLPYNDPCS